MTTGSGKIWDIAGGQQDDLPGGEAEETIFFLSDQDYCEVFETNPGKGGKYYILAHQYIAAQLNLLNAQLSLNQAKYFAKNAELFLLQISGDLSQAEF